MGGSQQVSCKEEDSGSMAANKGGKGGGKSGMVGLVVGIAERSDDCGQGKKTRKKRKGTRLSKLQSTNTRSKYNKGSMCQAGGT